MFLKHFNISNYLKSSLSDDLKITICNLICSCTYMSSGCGGVITFCGMEREHFGTDIAPCGSIEGECGRVVTFCGIDVAHHGGIVGECGIVITSCGTDMGLYGNVVPLCGRDITLCGKGRD